MLVPLSWLRDYVALDVPVEELADRVNISVAEVERIIRRGVPDQDGNLGLYRVGRVLEAGQHPKADRLQPCRGGVGERGRRAAAAPPPPPPPSPRPAGGRRALGHDVRL